MKKRGLMLVAVMCIALLAGGCKKENKDTNGDKQDKTTNVADLVANVTLGEYKGLDAELKVEEVTDEDVEDSIKSTLDSKSESKEVTDRAVKEGDTVNIDYVGTMDGKEFDGGKDEGFDLEIGSNSFIEGFESGLVGAKKGDKVVLDLNFPDPYDNNPDFAGKPVQFTVTINKITEKVVPELTDKLVAELSETAKTIDEYKKEVKTELETEAKTQAEEARKDEIWGKVIENAQVKEYPEAELTAAIEEVKQQYEQLASAWGFEVSALLGTDDEAEMEARFKEDGQYSLKQKMVVYALADKENLTLSDKEYDENIKSYADEYTEGDEKLLVDTYGKDYLTFIFTFEKVQKFVFDNAK